MKLTCSQMEILISFYIEDELSPCLKQQFEEHLSNCKTCSNKFKIVQSMIDEMKMNTVPDYSGNSFENNYETDIHSNLFNSKLSEYMDNELSNEESIKIKKIAITNKKARKELEDSYNIRRLMNDSFRKTKSDNKMDFTRNILKKLELEDENRLNFHPAINLLIVFTITTLVLTTVVLLAIK